MPVKHVKARVGISAKAEPRGGEARPCKWQDESAAEEILQARAQLGLCCWLREIAVNLTMVCCGGL